MKQWKLTKVLFLSLLDHCVGNGEVFGSLLPMMTGHLFMNVSLR